MFHYLVSGICFLDLFGFVEVSSLWQMSPLPTLSHYIPVEERRICILVYKKQFGISGLSDILTSIPIYSRCLPPPLCHTQCHRRPPAFTPPTKWRCLFTANRRKIQLLFNDNPEIEAAINTGKYTF